MRGEHLRAGGSGELHVERLRVARLVREDEAAGRVDQGAAEQAVELEQAGERLAAARGVEHRLGGDAGRGGVAVDATEHFRGGDRCLRARRP